MATFLFSRLPAAAVAAIVSAAAFAGARAQSPEPPIHHMRGLGMLTGMIGNCPMIGGMSTFVDDQIAFLKKELAITEAQQPAWERYATMLRQHLDRMLANQKHAVLVLEAKTPVERLRTYIRVMDERVSSLKVLEPALAELYAAMSSDQRERSDQFLSGLGCTM